MLVGAQFLERSDPDRSEGRSTGWVLVERCQVPTEATPRAISVARKSIKTTPASSQ
jgi:hypothetical protein